MASVFVVEVTAIVLVSSTAVVDVPPDGTDWLRALVLSVLGLAHTEAVLGVERVRRRVAKGNHIDLSSVWIFAGAVLLPASTAVLVVLAVQLHIWVRTSRPRVALYRAAFTTSTMVLACVAAAEIVPSVGAFRSPVPLQGTGLLAIALALLVFTTINSALVAGAVAMSSPQVDLTTVFGHWDDNVLELATLSLGGLAAVALVINPWLLLFVLPPLLVLHRAALVRHLQVAAATDSKTGLLNAAAWHTRAERALGRTSRAAGPRAVLVLDLDNFKAVNDTHGHLAGDHVLVAVADAVRSELRDRDLVGRFGGEEFVVLLDGRPGGDAADLEEVAERIRRRVATLCVEIPTPDGPLTIAGLSVSVGVAVHSGGVADLRDLLQVADTALYSAKRSGRNAVCLGSPPAVAQPTSSSRVTGSHSPPLADAP